ncbi:hypothetical protein Btru_014915 [Bulinus truncatus]|nr:hypothetical protein Btru_014915 [Bulinus truncatus]
MYTTTLFTVALVITCSQALVGRVCKVESECDVGECCQILSQFMVSSKRQDVSPKTGTCQKFSVEGEGCSRRPTVTEGVPPAPSATFIRCPILPGAASVLWHNHRLGFTGSTHVKKQNARKCRIENKPFIKS